MSNLTTQLPNVPSSLSYLPLSILTYQMIFCCCFLTRRPQSSHIWVEAESAIESARISAVLPATCGNKNQRGKVRHRVLHLFPFRNEFWYRSQLSITWREGLRLQAVGEPSQCRTGRRAARSQLLSARRRDACASRGPALATNFPLLLECCSLWPHKPTVAKGAEHTAAASRAPPDSHPPVRKKHLWL